MLRILVKIKGIILRPLPTLKEMKEGKPSLLEPFVIILSQGLLTGLATFVSVMKILDIIQIDPSEVGLEGFSGIRLVYGTLVFTFTAWFIISGVFHLIAKALRGSGTFEKLLELVGWCRMPQIFSSASNLLTMALYSPKIPDIPIESMSPAEKAEFLKSLMTTKPTEVGMAINRIFGLVMLIWFLALSVIAVREEHNLSYYKAAFTVAIPTLIYLIASLYFPTI